MTHPIIALQAGLVAALRADAGLQALVGDAVFDAPSRGASPPWVAIGRHDIVRRDGDGSSGQAHRLSISIWAAEPSRRVALAMAERVLAVAMAFAADGLAITHRQEERCDTAIDAETGRARAVLALTFFTEPAA